MLAEDTKHPERQPPWKVVGQNIKDKIRDKRFRDGDPSWGGSREGGVVSTQFVCGEFWNLRGEHNWEKKKKKTQNMRLTATTSGDREVAQRLTSDTSYWGLGTEAWAASTVLRVKTEREHLEDNWREIMWDSNPNRGITRETKKKKKERDRERDFPKKSKPAAV